MNQARGLTEPEHQGVVLEEADAVGSGGRRALRRLGDGEHSP